MVPPPSRRLPLAERYRPERLDDIVGNARARAELTAWADQWTGSQPPARRAAVLAGPAGVGKTTAALALARERGWTLVEMNASDARNESAIEQVAGRASITHTLGGSETAPGRRRALILLDEADCLTGRLTESAAPRPAPPSLSSFLQGRYRTIDALNTAYGLRPSGKPPAFADWGAVPRSPGNAAWARLSVARGDIEEWRGTQKSSDLSDRGGLAAISRLVRSTRQPVVLTVNDERSLTRYSPVFRTGVARIRFFPVRDPEIRARVGQIARAERIELVGGALDAIVTRARGDLRAALNDLDAISPLPAGPFQLTVLGARDLSSDFAALTEEVLSSPRFYRSVEVQNRLDAPPDDLLPWIEENLPHFAADARHRAAAFDVLAVADRFLNRARRARVWSLWSYSTELLTGGVALALNDRPVPGGGGASFPQFLGEMGRSRGLRGLRDGLVGKVGRRFHLSREKTIDTVLPFLEALFSAGGTAVQRPDLVVALRRIARELDLSPEEVAFLASTEPGAPLVSSILAPAPETVPPPPAPAAGETAPAATTARGMGDAPPRRTQRQLSDFGT